MVSSFWNAKERTFETRVERSETVTYLAPLTITVLRNFCRKSRRFPYLVGLRFLVTRLGGLLPVRSSVRCGTRRTEQLEAGSWGAPCYVPEKHVEGTSSIKMLPRLCYQPATVSLAKAW